MNDNKKIKMPYQESEQYLDELIERTANNAIQHKQIPILRYAAVTITSAAAVILLWNIASTADSGITHQSPIARVEKAGPIDKFINSLTDEEIEQIICYDIEEIPEY